MTCTEDYREYIEYTFNAFCKLVIRCAARGQDFEAETAMEREVSLEYLMNEKFGAVAASEPDEEYILTVCGDTVIFSNGLLAEAILSRRSRRGK